jgi:cadmium resistance protein CadD (predicted permease)
VAGVTIANGADNISVYTPVFRTIGVTPTVVTIAVYLVLLGVGAPPGHCLAVSRALLQLL